MIQSAFTHAATVQTQILTRDQIEEIVRAAFEILEKVGFKMADAKARDVLQKHGAVVKADHVRMSRHLAQEALRTAPQGFTIYDRLGNKAMHMEGRKSYFGSSTGSPRTLDPLTGEVRPTTLSDIARGALITDALPNVDFAMPMGSAQDVVPPLAQEVHEFEALVNNTVKPLVMLTYNRQAFRWMYEMAAAIAGGWEELRCKPFLLAYPEPITPLVFPANVTDRIMQVAEWGLPQVFGPVGQVGATGPVTMAGMLSQVTAESMACLTLAQLVNPGAPCFLSANISGFDMQTGAICPGSPETSLGTSAMAEIGRYFGLPSWGVAGTTDAKVLDAQAGVESAFSIITQAMTGVNLIHDLGYLDGSMVCGPEMMVLGDEVVGMIARFIKGVPVSDETLQAGLIAKVCPGGNYLQEEHTYQNFRNELWIPSVMTRDRYDAWEAKGRMDVRQRIVAKIEHILANHKPVPLSAESRRAIEEIRKTADKELAA